MLITHNDVLIAAGSVAAGLTYFLGWWTRGPRAGSLDKAWNEGYDTGRREAYDSGYAVGVDDESRGLAYAYDRDGNPADSRPGLPPGPGPDDGGPQIDSAAPEPGPRDWGDELSGMRTTVRLDSATEVLEAAPPPQPDPWEYRLASWAVEQDRWLDGKRAEIAADLERLGVRR
jgi:hypothetical protein